MNHPAFFALVLALFISPHACAARDTADFPRARPPQAPAETKKETPQPRRSVPARTPETLIVPSTTTQVPLSRSPATALPRPAQAVQPDRPAPVTGCDPGGCWDAGGNRYNSGAGNTYMNNAGRLCTRNGAWMQCF